MKKNAINNSLIKQRQTPSAQNLESKKSISAPSFHPTAEGKSIQMKAEEEEEALQTKMQPFQLNAEEEEERLQMKKAPFQLSMEEEEEVQMKANPTQMSMEEEEEVRMKANPTQMSMEEEEEVQMKANPMQMSMEEEEEVQMKANPTQMSMEEEEEVQMKTNPTQMSMEEEEEVQMKANPTQMSMEEEEEVQMKSARSSRKAKKAESSSKVNLPKPVQAKMESSFNSDFSGLTIHKDSTKAENLGAQAFAQGNEVHFAKGKYNPNSQSGQELIGHELTHVVQQRQGRVQTTTQKKGANINDSSSLEQEADHLGKKAAKGENAGIKSSRNSRSNQNGKQATQLKPEEGNIIQDLVGYAGKAQKIHEAVAGLGTDEDTIFQILLPLSKSGVKSLQRVYKLMYGVSLVSDLRNDLTNDEFRRALIYIFCWPSENDIIGSFQAERAQEMLLNFSAWKISMICDLILMLNNKQASYFYKAIAAGNSISALIIFAYIIKGKSDDWLQNNLSLTGHTDGSGIKQQYSHSCNATAVQAFRGEMDPIYAYTMIQSNTDVTAANNNNATAINPSMAADQKAMLESNYDGSLGTMGGGTAVNRNAPNGVGRWADDLLNSNSEDTGVSYSTLRRGDGHSLNTLILSIKKGAKRGIPVPIVIGGSPTAYTHYVLVTGIDTSVTPNSFTVHDVGSGQQYIVTEDDFKNSTIGIPGLNTLSAVEDVTEE